jgi:hypothetical protein
MMMHPRLAQLFGLVLDQSHICSRVLKVMGIPLPENDEHRRSAETFVNRNSGLN